MPTERGLGPTTCPTCGAPVRLAPISAVDSAAGLTRSYQPVKPREDPAAVERAAEWICRQEYGESLAQLAEADPEDANSCRTRALETLRAAGEGGSDG